MMMTKLGNEVTDAEVRDIITESGSSKPTGITYSEFQKLMGIGVKNLRVPEDPEEEMQQAFRLFDTDGDGADSPIHRRLAPSPAHDERHPPPLGTPPHPPTHPTAAPPLPPPPSRPRPRVVLSPPRPAFGGRLHLRQGDEQGALNHRRHPGDG
jgi:hypothetical protein